MRQVPDSYPIRRGSVVMDRGNKLWLCVRSATLDMPALMTCEDHRIKGPVRRYHNLHYPLMLVAEPTQEIR